MIIVSPRYHIRVWFLLHMMFSIASTVITVVTIATTVITTASKHFRVFNAPVKGASFSDEEQNTTRNTTYGSGSSCT